MNVHVSFFVHFHNLSVRMRIHTGGKYFKCKVSARKFTRFVILSKHLMSHTDEKCFMCFVQHILDILNMHLKIHTDEKLFKCEICSKQFTWGESLRKHFRVRTS